MSTLLLFSMMLMQISATTQPDASELRVMSFNIRFGTANDGPNHWDNRRGAVIAAIKAFDPHILGTQETLGFQRDFIATELLQFAAVGVGRDDGKETGEMTATFYRRDRFDLVASGHFWLSTTPDVPGSKSWDTAITRMATWLKLRDCRRPDAPAVLVINTHFDHVGRVARQESAKLLRTYAEKLGKDCSVIITGDFNCDEDDTPYSELAGQTVAERKLVDTYRSLHSTREKNEATFTAFKVDAIDGKRIDFIFATEDFKVKAAAIDRDKYNGQLPSDHFPVTTVLSRIGD